MCQESIKMLRIHLEREKLQDRESERKFHFTIFEGKTQLSSVERTTAFEVSKVSKFILSFNEDDPELFFMQFERVSNTQMACSLLANLGTVCFKRKSSFNLVN